MTARTIPRRALMRGAVGATAAIALPGCAGILRMDPQGWRNALGTAYVLPRWQWSPTCAADLMIAVQRAETEGRRIRMTGSGHSFSDVAMNDDWLLSPLALTRMLDVDRSSLKPFAQPETLIRFQSGLTIHALNEVLDARGLALENMGAADVQTFVGAASTGTHGSGLAFGPLASLIESIQVVGAGGHLLQVEPADKGITDRARFAGRLAELPAVKVELVQDDTLFDALSVGLGNLGVIYSVTIRTVPAFWLIERRTLCTWEELAREDGFIDRLVSGARVRPILPDHSPLGAGACIPDDCREPDHVEINYCPYPEADGRHTAMLTLRWRTSCKPPGVGKPRGSRLFEIGMDFTLLAFRLGILPAFTPKATEKIRKFQVTAMKEMAQAYYANASHDVFTVGAIDDLNVYGIELAFAIEKTKNAVARNLEVAKYLAGEGIHHSSPPTLRFMNSSSSLVAMQNGRRTVTMEFGVFTTAYGAEELCRTYEDAFVGGELGGRPHWGLDRNHLKSEKAVRDLYPATWDAFKAALATLNPHGTFDGSLSDRLGISRAKT